MKHAIVGLSLIAFVYFFGILNSKEVEKSFGKINQELSKNIQEGDIILQTSESSQCEAVRIATKSKFSHCGIIFKKNNQSYVLEAVQPVKITSLTDWISHGKNNDYVIKRVKNSEKILNSDKIEKMKKYGKSLLNKDYDLYFEWNDDKMYCSELVWKIYKEGAGIELCPFKKLKDFDLSKPEVKAILKQRYGNQIPLNEKVIAPSQLAESNTLITITDTYTN